MVKLLIFIVLVLLLGSGFAWFANRPGDLMITWQGQQIEMSLIAGVALVVALIIAVLVVVWLIRKILASPRIASRYVRRRKRDRGYEALSTGLLAAGAGDAVTARKMNKRTRGLLSADREPLIHLLDAQTALIEGDHETARAKFESMADNPKTRDLALRGLYLEARRLDADEAARHYAEQASETSAHLPWAAEAALEYRGRGGEWDEALVLLEKQRLAQTVTRAEADRKKAVLLTARAMERLDGNPQGARTDGLEAVRLAPGLVPASVIAAKALFREENLRKGTRVLEKAWKNEPHPELAETHVRARPGDSTLDRLKRAQKLESLKPNHIESLMVVARAALDAQKFQMARAKAEAAARQQSREGIYLLLADIEEAETGDQGRVRHWLSQAVRAGRDPAWTADGYVAEKWAPVSPVTGQIDAFVWRVPVEQLSGPVEEGNTLAADRAIRSLPPLMKSGTDTSATTGSRPEKAAGTTPTDAVIVEATDARRDEKSTAPAAATTDSTPAGRTDRKPEIDETTGSDDEGGTTSAPSRG